MSLTSLRNHVHRNGFDLSRKNAFTAKVGEILPVMVEEVLPGDKFKINTQWFTRTSPVETAAFTRIKEYYDFFFVPTRLLWRYWPTFINQVPMQHSARTIEPYPVGQYSQQPYFTFSDMASTIKYFIQSDGEAVFPYKRNLFGFDRGAAMRKLVSYLGYPDPLETSSKRGNDILNPFPLLAYQKIYQDYYRDSRWEETNPSSCNVDYAGGVNQNNWTNIHLPVGNLTVVSDATVKATPNMFDLQYCNWNKDYFMGLLPSPQYGDTAFVPLNGATENNDTFSLPMSTSEMELYASRLGEKFANIGVKPTSSDFVKSTHNHGLRTANISILALRQAQALQKWKEITQSGSYDYDVQMERHWNVKVSKALNGHCMFIGGTSANLSINEVVNQNITGDNEAFLAGKGVGSGQGNINFSSDEHGYLLCLYHAVPLLDYRLNRISRMHSRHFATDYAIPEFDNLGMEPVLAHELTVSENVWGEEPDTVLGYAPRYAEYKTAVDEIHGDFTQSRSNWVAPLDPDYYFEALITSGYNYKYFKVNPSILNPIFVAQIDQAINKSTNGSDWRSDQLLINAAFDVKAVRNLDYDGLPY